MYYAVPFDYWCPDCPMMEDEVCAACEEEEFLPQEARRRRSKQRDKMIERKDFLGKSYTDGNVYSSWNDYLAHLPDWPDSEKFWKRYYFSGQRKLAKQKTNRKIRNEFRSELNRMIDEDNEHRTGLLRGSDYRKVLDCLWHIW